MRNEVLNTRAMHLVSATYLDWYVDDLHMPNIVIAFTMDSKTNGKTFDIFVTAANAIEN